MMALHVEALHLDERTEGSSQLGQALFASKALSLPTLRSQAELDENEVKLEKHTIWERAFRSRAWIRR